MSDVGEWLEDNAGALAAIAEETRTEARLVHLVAVLVFAGLDDEAIRDQLSGVRRAPHGPGDTVEAATRSLPRIRRLAA